MKIDRCILRTRLRAGLAVVRVGGGGRVYLAVLIIKIIKTALCKFELFVSLIIDSAIHRLSLFQSPNFVAKSMRRSRKKDATLRNL